MAVIYYKSGQVLGQNWLSKNDALTLNGTASPGYLITVTDGNFVVGTTTANANGDWSFSSPVVADRVHLFEASASNGLGDEAHALGLYAPARPLNYVNTTTFTFSSTGIDINFDPEQQQNYLAFRHVTNHYDYSGQIISQTINYVSAHDQHNYNEVITSPDSDGTTVDTIQYPNGLYFGISNNIVKTYYDSSFKVIHQDTYSASGSLLSVMTGVDSDGNSILTNYSSDGSFTQTGYTNNIKIYTNHYNPSSAILSQDRFDSSSHLSSTTTAPDTNGDISSTIYDVTGHVVAHVQYNSADTLLDLNHITDGNSESAIYQLYTGDGIQTIGVQLGDKAIGDSLVFNHAYTDPSHTTIMHYDAHDTVYLSGYDASHPYTAVEDGTNVTLTLSDDSRIVFDHFAHLSDINIHVI